MHNQCFSSNSSCLADPVKFHCSTYSAINYTKFVDIDITGITKKCVHIHVDLFSKGTVEPRYNEVLGTMKTGNITEGD